MLYEKPTQTDSIIPSNHFFTQKISIFNSVFYKLKHIPLNRCNYNHKFNVIRDIYIYLFNKRIFII